MTVTKINPTKKKEETNKTEKQLGNECKIQISYINPSKDFQWSKTIRCLKLKDFLIILSILVVLGLTLWAVIFFSNLITENEDFDQETKHLDISTPQSDFFRIISRLIWLAQPPIEPIPPLGTPTSLVIIHHTATSPCSTQAQCVLQTRYIQEYHIASKNWSDIGYNFLVGGDGQAYEGRGWSTWGAHTRGYNNRSIGVGLIGTFITKIPPENQLRALNKLMDQGVRLGYLTYDYKILAARQVADTKSPGTAFFEVIKTWDRWTEKLTE